MSYDAFGAITSLTHLGVSETRTYNVLGQMTRMTKGSLIDVEYRFSSTQNDGKILSQKNWLTGEDVVYQYDELERLISAATTNNTAWGLSFSYDGFGNRLSQSVTQGSGPTNTVLVDGNTNRISSSGYAFDANGNMTQMPKGSGSMTLDYDLSNRLQKATHPDGAEDYRYAPDNRRVWRSAGKTACQGVDNGGGIGAVQPESNQEQLVFYSPGGQKMGVYCVTYSPNGSYPAVTASEEHVYFGARLVGKRLISVTGTASGVVSDFTADRLQSKGDGSKYYPYGESKTGAAGDDREGFATYTRDSGTGLDYADQRWYAGGLGRFLQSDPYTPSADTSDPIAFNRLAYVNSNPVSYNDPLGLMINNPNTYAPAPPPPPQQPPPPPGGPVGVPGKDAPVPNTPPDEGPGPAGPSELEKCKDEVHTGVQAAEKKAKEIAKSLLGGGPKPSLPGVVNALVSGFKGSNWIVAGTAVGAEGAAIAVGVTVVISMSLSALYPLWGPAVDRAIEVTYSLTEIQLYNSLCLKTSTGNSIP